MKYQIKIYDADNDDFTPLYTYGNPAALTRDKPFGYGASTYRAETYSDPAVIDSWKYVILTQGITVNNALNVQVEIIVIAMEEVDDLPLS